MHFAPGALVEYSSTNYVLLGLVLLAHDPSAGGDWTKLDVPALLFPPSLRDKYRRVAFLADQPLNSALTVPGASGMIEGKLTPIWGQRAGVLGWTCGNMVASATDVASFYYDLLVARSLLDEGSLAQMETFRTLSYGWAEGHIAYGAGLMVEAVNFSRHSGAPQFGRWGSYMGHGGDTYGFLSEQGIIGQLDNASFSVVSNEDYEGSFVQHSVACRVIKAAAKVLKDVALDFECGI